MQLNNCCYIIFHQTVSYFAQQNGCTTVVMKEFYIDLKDYHMKIKGHNKWTLYSEELQNTGRVFNTLLHGLCNKEYH